MASLIITTGRKTGSFYSLGQDASIVGREQGVLVQIVNEFVSRKHMQIRHDPETDTYHVQDLNSRHGTFVNGNRIHEEVSVSEGDLLDIGGVTLMFTRKDFEDRDGAMAFCREADQRVRTALQAQ
jgi:pSer/pThr/pTyr-binding forkhead associated (FHA) protein